MTADVVANRYAIISKLGEGGMGTVYAAYDRLKKERVAFKQIRENAAGGWEANNTQEKVVLAHEFQILASLKHPHIISVIDFGFTTQEDPYFTMTLLEEPQTVIQYGRNLSFEQRIDLILQMLLALAYLHRNGIIHRDLKPDNALVTPNGRLRVLDFGIAVPDRYEHDENTIFGTLAYMAPEMIRGEPVSRASDLYAVGVISYQLFTGNHPFDLSKTFSLVQEVMNKQPDLDTLQTHIQQIDRGGTGYLETDEHEREEQEAQLTARVDIDEKFDTDSLEAEQDNTVITPRDDMVETLQVNPLLMTTDVDFSEPTSEKDKAVEKPAFSLPTSEVRGLVAVINQLMEKNPAHRFQNAEAVIRAICDILDRPFPDDVAIRESYLQAAKFVGRELEIDKLRSALETAVEDSRGSTWLIGGESGVGKSRLLNELRIEALVRGVVVLDGQGVVGGGVHYQYWREPLRRLAMTVEVTDIEAGILKAIISDIEELIGREVEDPPALEETGKDRLINTIVTLFRKADQPLLLILEDLQWGAESLGVLRSIMPLVDEHPLMIIGSYRSDERPDLPDDLPNMSLIHLERLDEKDIEALSVSMLGSVGKNQEVIELLKRETEGNVFFLVEVVRALAAEAGHLDRITAMRLPERVFAGGIQQIVERRFERVPENAHYPLRFAAVAGRQVSLEMIQHVMPDLDIETWLTECSAAAVLEVVNGQWRFAHEKLREGLLASLEVEERRKLHYQVAETLIEIHGKSSEYAQVICDHFENAGATDKAAEWYVRAGKSAQTAYVAVAATAYYEKAIYYWASHPARTDEFTTEERMTAYLGLGTMYFWQGRYNDAIGIFEALQELAIEADKKDSHADSLRWIANCRLYKGETGAATEMLDKAEVIARHVETRKPLAQVLWVRGIINYMSGDFKGTVNSGEQLLAIAKELDNQVLMAQANNLLGAVRYAQGDYQAAADHWAAQYEQAMAIGELGPAIAALNNLGLVAEGRGDYDTAIERYQEAVTQVRRAGIRDQYMLYFSNLAGVQVRRGEIDEALDNLNTIIEMAEQAPFTQLSETYRFLAEALLVQQKEYAALEAVQRSMELAQNAGSPDMLAGAWRVLGQVASMLIQSVHPTVESEEYVDAQECFIQSDTICQENGLVGDRARTLREWARHEYRYGNDEDGLELWTKATQLYEQVGADLEVERMKYGPQ